jgi:hypothetical protein
MHIASIASRTNVRDDRETPLLSEAGRADYRGDLRETRSEIFFASGLDKDFKNFPDGKIRRRTVEACSQQIGKRAFPF